MGDARTAGGDENTYMIQPLGTGKTRQDKTGKTGHAEIRYLDRHNSGQRLHVLLPAYYYCTIGSFRAWEELDFAGSKTHVLHSHYYYYCMEDVDAHVAVRAKCTPRLAVKRWRLAPTHPLQAEATLLAAAAAAVCSTCCSRMMCCALSTCQ